MKKVMVLILLCLSVLNLAGACNLTGSKLSAESVKETAASILTAQALDQKATAQNPAMPQLPPTLLSTAASQKPALTEPPVQVGTVQPLPKEQPGEVKGKEVQANGIRFFLPETVAEDSFGTVYQSKAASPDLPYWEKYPDYFRFDFRKYNHPGSIHTPRIQISSVSESIKLNPAFEKTVNQLKAIIAKKSADGINPNELPFPPIFNAARQFSAQQQYLEFKNGSGIRYMTFFTQAITPTTNDGLMLTFQGLTADGQYYISAILPIFCPLLNGESSHTAVDDNFIKNYAEYLKKIEDFLSDTKNEDYKPNLSSLDMMVKSMEVTPKSSPDTIYSQEASFLFGNILLNSKMGINWVEDNSDRKAGEVSAMPMEVHPQLGGLLIKDYPLQGQLHDARIISFKVDEFVNMVPFVQDSVNGLKDILAQGKEIGPEQKLPFFPIFNAAQIFSAKPQILRTPNGIGLRYLAMYGQAFAPVDNYNLFYTYQGLSNDEKTYVIVILPIKAASLKDQESFPADMDAFTAGFEQYIKDTRTKMNELQPEQFIPNLEEIDRMIETIHLW
ncbi:MAG: hypothetical protein VB108_07445 [Anaerolineaceae bacterium]|nr:hypothetical protein [Anaerolineaceae bacterium]